MQHIGKRIKLLLDESKYSAKEIAEKMGTSFQNVYRLFEKESVETKYLFVIAEALGISITQFFEEESRDNLTQEIRELKDELRSCNEIISQLQTQNELFKKLLEVSEDKFKKRVESNNFLASLFNVLEDPKYKNLGNNISARMFTLAKDLLKEGDVNAYLLVSKISNDPEMVKLIELANKKTPSSL